MKINFDLTDEQAKTLEPLVRQASKAAFEGITNRGVILAQIMHGQVSAKFIKAETAGKVITILKEDNTGES